MRYTVTAENQKQPVTNVSAPSPERAVEKVEQFLGMMLYKPQAIEESIYEEIIDLDQYVAELIEIGYEQGRENDFGDALRIFCDRQKKPATITNIEAAEKRFAAEFKNEGDGNVTFGI